MSVAIAVTDVNNDVLCFNYGDERICFERSVRQHDATKVKIKVHPNGKVEVVAPASVGDDEVIRAVKKRSRWIYQKLRDFRQQQAFVLPRHYISGESHYYLGRRYVLKIAESKVEAEEVKLTHGTLHVNVRSKSADRVQALLNNWYKERAREVFTIRLEQMLEKALWVPDPPPLRVFSMKTQWGSCSPSGRLTLNPHLVKAPRECIDYVILHELCHIAEHNHSHKFYRLMKQVMPHWESVKERLDNMANYLIA